MGPPARLETERLILRRYEPDDLQALRDAVDSSLDTIRRWMPNTTRELSGDLGLWLRDARRQFDEGERFAYGLFTRADGTFVGHISAIPGDDGCVEFGYWAHASFMRQGFVSEAVRALVRPGIGDRFVIYCSPENEASMGVARTCGFTLVETRMVPHEGRDYPRARWELRPSSRSL